MRGSPSNTDAGVASSRDRGSFCDNAAVAD
jgi:hypothetical protein